MKKLLLVTALTAIVMAPATIAYASYPDTSKPVVQDNGSGGIPSQLYAFTCYQTCNNFGCTTNCW